MDSKDLTADIDPCLLEIVITNLLSNALKYTESGRVMVKLKCNTHAEISVEDSGCGIPSDELGKVTDRYHRATTALSRGIEGTGIGLALAKEIIRLHDGELLMMSTTAEASGKEHGSTFLVRIPLKNRVIEAYHGVAAFGSYGKQLVDKAMHASGGGYSSTSELGSDDSKSPINHTTPSDGFFFHALDVILIVDNNQEISRYIKQIFNPFCTILTAVHGKEAMDIAMEKHIDLIVSDHMMPVMNGQELLEAIRENEKTRAIPFIMLSAAGDEDFRLAALRTGAEDFILKPLRLQELLARSHLHLHVGKKRRAFDLLYRQREQEISILSDYCPSGIVRAKANGHIVYANAAWRGYLGIPAEGDPNLWSAQLRGTMKEENLALWDEIINGDCRKVSATWDWSNGARMSGTFVRLDKVDPSMSGVVGCLQDVTFQEQALKDAERRRVEAKQAKLQQELLIDITSHEIRTPVSAILQCSSLVKENLIELRAMICDQKSSSLAFGKQVLLDLDQDIEALESIYQCGLVQERIAGDILSLARIQLDTLSIHAIEVDLVQEARKVVSMFSPEAKMKGIDLSLSLGRGLLPPPAILIDHVRLGQIVTNLIANAIRFTAPELRRQIRVVYELFPSDVPLVDDHVLLCVSVTVSDSGPGMTEEEQENLLKQFSQGNSTIHSRYGGSGLGLFICKRIVELMGGQISVTSRPGHGSDFQFVVPVRQIHEQDPTATLAIDDIAAISPGVTEGQIRRSLSSHSNQRHTGDSGAKGLQILVVEDNLINQTILKRQLEKKGWICKVAENGKEALEKVRQSRSGNGFHDAFDAVLMDVEMPVMDGLTAVQAIRDKEEGSQMTTPQLVIAITGNARSGQIQAALDAGMDEVVVKPYKLPHLCAKVLEAVTSRRKAETIAR